MNCLPEGGVQRKGWRIVVFDSICSKLAAFASRREDDHVASYCELCDQNAGNEGGGDDEDDEENLDRRRKPIEPLPRVNHEDLSIHELRKRAQGA